MAAITLREIVIAHSLSEAGDCWSLSVDGAVACLACVQARVLRDLYTYPAQRRKGYANVLLRAILLEYHGHLTAQAEPFADEPLGFTALLEWYARTGAHVEPFTGKVTWQ